MALNALATTQPANQKPTGNLYMAPSGQTYANQASAPQTLTQGQSYTDPAGRTGTVNYDTSTGAKLATGATTYSTPYANQSTTTLSSNKTPDILNITNKQDALTNGSGIRTDTNSGVATYANGSVVQPPKAPNDPSNMYNTETGQLNTNYTGYKPPTNDGTTSTGGYYNNLYIAPGGTVPKDANGQPVALTATNPQDDAFNSMLLDLKAKSDAIGAAQIDNIQSAYANLIKQQELANASAAAGTTAYLVGAGRGVGSSDAVLQGTISYGIQQIANLQTQKNGDIIKAQQAISDNDFKYASAIQDRIDKNTALQQTEYDKVQEHILQAAKDLAEQKQKQVDAINQVALEAAKSGAPADAMKAIKGATSVADAIAAYAPYAQDPTSDAGQYNSYVKATQAKGLVPMTADAWMAKKEATKAYNNAYSAAAGKAAAEAKLGGGGGYNGTTQKQQISLEQQYRQILAKEFSSRSGALGVENGKVNQANHLNSLFSQYYDPKTGNYNIPKTQYAEIAIGLANLVSPSGTVTEGARDAIMQKTAAGDINGAISYATGTPQNGSTQDVYKNLLDSIDRQAETATRNREQALQNMRDMAPTDLDPKRVDALNKSTEMVGYEGEDRLAKSRVNDFLAAHGNDMVQTTDGKHSLWYMAAQAANTPGVTPDGIENYLKTNGWMQ